jgi:hypothetical protein
MALEALLNNLIFSRSGRIRLLKNKKDLIDIASLHSFVLYYTSLTGA